MICYLSMLRELWTLNFQCDQPYFYVKLVYEMVGKMSTALSPLLSRTCISGTEIPLMQKKDRAEKVSFFWRDCELAIERLHQSVV